VDCEPCVKAVHMGLKRATSDSRAHARVNTLMHAALDDTAADAVVWMPAHKGEADIGAARLGDGSYLTRLDFSSNAEADRLAKLAVEEHRVAKGIVAKVREQEALIEAAARWIATATFEAGHQTTKPIRDTDASKTRKAASMAAGLRLTVAQQPKAAIARPFALGGHDLRRRGGAWECRVCRRRSKRHAKLAPKRCEGSAALEWATKARALTDHGLTNAGSHARVMSGDLIWCTRCGSFSEHVGKGLAKACRGRFQGSIRGGLPGQLKRLMAGWHPVTRAALPPPIPESRWQCSRSCGAVPCASLPSVSTAETGRSGRFEALRERIRAMEAAARSVGPPGESLAPEARAAHRWIRRRITRKRNASEVGH
jgi:hypothetical protein